MFDHGPIIGIDFDGTIVEHEFPSIGKPIPHAFRWMKKFQKAGARLILWTMRSDGQRSGDVLTEAVEFCRVAGVEFWGVNANPEQHWSSSPKAYCHMYVDDAAARVPLRPSRKKTGRPFVDWTVVGPHVMKFIEEF